MKGWNKVPFGDLLIDSKDGEWGEGAPGVGLIAADMIRGTDFADLNSPSKSFPRRYVNERHAVRKRLQVGDIIFEMAGGTAKQSTGRSALITQNFLNRRSETFVLCASFCRHLRVDHSKYDPKFTYYLLQTLYGAGYMSVFNIQHTGVSRFQYTSFKKHTVLDIPGLATQRKIAAILSAYDDLIANNQRRITLLERMAEDIYREWFVRLRFPGYKDKSNRIEKGVPHGWFLVPLERAFRFYGGATPSRDTPRYWNNGDVNWFTPTDITGAEGMFLSSSGERCTEEGVESCSSKMFPAYSVMMTSRATIGAIGINLTPACTNQGFITCIPNEAYPLGYLYHWLKLGKPYFESLSGGSTFAELTKGTFKRMEILTPPKPLVQQFQKLVAPLFKAIETDLKVNESLKATRDALLPRLISGKLAIDKLDIKTVPK
ncbi:MAG: restriction endonuclease subunit S [Pseudomonadota bacterium]